ncbi:hypothetical protein BDF20DRAFT_407172 [Mycotypha africana]|uniref:uncharacterized protein n=1 Tax=Mycotypha africana TaxID=64632 RepID=UPI00230114CD|nr:uncharacterized protein BDF20DRAFT_407172 [Mycotypha africana]KAI8984744.1 hypothetical protein BDF20DRAFT_407172 [Mycotypha africana]
MSEQESPDSNCNNQDVNSSVRQFLVETEKSSQKQQPEAATTATTVNTSKMAEADNIIEENVKLDCKNGVVDDRKDISIESLKNLDKAAEAAEQRKTTEEKLAADSQTTINLEQPLFISMHTMLNPKESNKAVNENSNSIDEILEQKDIIEQSEFEDFRQKSAEHKGIKEGETVKPEGNEIEPQSSQKINIDMGKSQEGSLKKGLEAVEKKDSIKKGTSTEDVVINDEDHVADASKDVQDIADSTASEGNSIAGIKTTDTVECLPQNSSMIGKDAVTTKNGVATPAIAIMDDNGRETELYKPSKESRWNQHNDDDRIKYHQKPSYRNKGGSQSAYEQRNQKPATKIPWEQMLNKASIVNSAQNATETDHSRNNGANTSWRHINDVTQQTGNDASHIATKKKSDEEIKYIKDPKDEVVEAIPEIPKDSFSWADDIATSDDDLDIEDTMIMDGKNAVNSSIDIIEEENKGRGDAEDSTEEKRLPESNNHSNDNPSSTKDPIEQSVTNTTFDSYATDIKTSEITIASTSSESTNEHASNIITRTDLKADQNEHANNAVANDNASSAWNTFAASASNIVSIVNASEATKTTSNEKQNEWKDSNLPEDTVSSTKDSSVKPITTTSPAMANRDDHASMAWNASVETVSIAAPLASSNTSDIKAPKENPGEWNNNSMVKDNYSSTWGSPIGSLSNGQPYMTVGESTITSSLVDQSGWGSDTVAMNNPTVIHEDVTSNTAVRPTTSKPTVSAWEEGPHSWGRNDASSNWGTFDNSFSTTQPSTAVAKPTIQAPIQDNVSAWNNFKLNETERWEKVHVATVEKEQKATTSRRGSNASSFKSFSSKYA